MTLYRRLSAALVFCACAAVTPGWAQLPTNDVAAGSQDNRAESQPSDQSGQAQQMMKEARVELERAAIALENAGPDTQGEAIDFARRALAQFEQSLEQLDQSVPGFVEPELADSLLAQVSRASDLLDGDITTATLTMHELTLRVTDITAEADLFLGRTVLGPNGAEIGIVSNVLITTDGRMGALVIKRSELGDNSQFIIEWANVTIEGTNLFAQIDLDETRDLPDYITR